MCVNDLIIEQYPDHLILACKHRVEHHLPWDRCDSQIVDLILAYEEELVNYLPIHALVAVQNVVTGRPEVLALHMQGFDGFCVRGIQLEELFAFLCHATDGLASCKE
jgi:hypothetical protein